MARKGQRTSSSNPMRAAMMKPSIDSDRPRKFKIPWDDLEGKLIGQRNLFMVLVLSSSVVGGGRGTFLVTGYSLALT